MQYPELDIGRFARENPVNMEVDKTDTGYLLMLTTDLGSEDRYPLDIVARPQSDEQLGEIFKDHFADYPSSDMITVYGNNEEAMRSVAGRDTWGRFEDPKTEEKIEQYKQIVSQSVPEAREDILETKNLDYGKLLALEEAGEDRTGLTLYIKRKIDEGFEYEPKGWAVDVEPLIRGKIDSPAEEIADRIAAATTYMINRAESGGEVGPDLEEFHLNLLRDQENNSGPIEIDFEETAQDNRGTAEIAETREETEFEMDYDEMVSGTIRQARERIESVEGELDQDDWQKLLNAEERGQDRVTFKPYLERKLKEEG